MTEARKRGGRRGGRAARQAERAAPLHEDLRPVRPGMEGGRYMPLTDAEILKVHHAALEVLETVGLCDAIPSCIEAVTAAGGRMSDTGRLLFPRALIEDTIAKAARRFPIYAQNPAQDMEPWGKRVYFGTAGAAVHMVDAMTGEHRDSTLADLYDIARLVDTLDVAEAETSTEVKIFKLKNSIAEELAEVLQNAISADATAQLAAESFPYRPL